MTDGRHASSARGEPPWSGVSKYVSDVTHCMGEGFHDVRRQGVLAAFSVAFALSLLAAHKLVLLGGIHSDPSQVYFDRLHPIDILFALLSALVIHVAANMLVAALPARSSVCFPSDNPAGARSFCVLCLIIALSWLPYVLTYFPGGVYADTSASFKMALGEIPLDNHHPILYTLLWRAAITMGDALFGWSVQRCLKIFLFGQYVLAVMTCAWCVQTMRHHGAGRLLTGLSLVFFSLFPLVPLNVVSLWKDTPFNFAVLLLATTFVRLADASRSCRRGVGVRLLIAYALSMLLVNFLRNNGIFVSLIGGMAFLVFLMRRGRTADRWRCGLVVLVVTVATLIVHGPVYDACGYNKDKDVESLGIPLQQLACIMYNDGFMPERDEWFLDDIMPRDAMLEAYHPMVVDSIKWNPQFDEEYLSEHLRTFFGVYARAVINNPQLAIKGYALSTVGFWDSSRQLADAYVNIHTWPGLPYEQHDLVVSVSGISLKDRIEPPILISSALFGWLILLCALVPIALRRSVDALPLVPGIALWGTIMLAAPLAFSMRYMFSLVLLVPLAILSLIGRGVPCTSGIDGHR